MYSPKFEDDFLKHIPAKYKQVYLQFLLRNIGLFAESEKNENRQKFLYFLISGEGLNVAKTNGALILYNDENLNKEV
jgi:hypothetical protein